MSDKRVDVRFGAGEYSLPAPDGRNLQQTYAVPYFLDVLQRLAPNVPRLLVDLVEPAYQIARRGRFGEAATPGVCYEPLAVMSQVVELADADDASFRALRAALENWADRHGLACDLMYGAALRCLSSRFPTAARDLSEDWVGFQLGEATDTSRVPTKRGVEVVPAHIPFHEFYRFDGSVCTFQDDEIQFRFDTEWDPQAATAASFRELTIKEFTTELDAFIKRVSTHAENLGMRKNERFREMTTNFERLVYRRVYGYTYEKIGILLQNKYATRRTENESSIQKGIKQAETLLGLSFSKRIRANRR